MKKLSAILLLTMLLMNIMGYYIVFMGMQHNNDVSVAKRLDLEQYDESQTVLIKLPIAVPYLSDNQEFQRVDGLFEHNGEFYRLVKQKYTQDTLVVVCVKDNENKRIHEALTDYVKTFTDKTSDHQSQGKLSVSFIKDYITQTFEIKSATNGWHTAIVGSNCTKNLTPSFFASIIHPPERA
ncbi:MAG: hypothetical protein ABIS36_16330 [Chryseolinea sp.]